MAPPTQPGICGAHAVRSRALSASPAIGCDFPGSGDDRAASDFGTLLHRGKRGMPNSTGRRRCTRPSPGLSPGTRLAYFDESVPRGKKDELKPRFEPKLPKDVRYVDANGLACDAQSVGHLFVAQALG
jgi:hypothetical protein